MDTAASPLPERRLRPRQFCRLPALIQCGSSSQGLDCIVENLSPGGARVRLARKALVTSTFRVVLPTVWVAYDARLTWRRNLDLGIEVIRRHDLSVGADSLS